MGSNGAVDDNYQVAPNTGQCLILILHSNPYQDKNINPNAELRTVTITSALPLNQTSLTIFLGLVLCHVVIMGSWPLPAWEVILPCPDRSVFKPSSRYSGILLPLSRAIFSAQTRILTSWRIADSRLCDWRSRIARLTLSATSKRSSGFNKAASSGSRLSEGNISNDMVFSRSPRNFWFVGALGPSCSVANLSAGPMSLPGLLQVRISSTS